MSGTGVLSVLDIAGKMPGHSACDSKPERKTFGLRNAKALEDRRSFVLVNA